MSKRLLSTYIRLAVREAHLARVPNQLVSDSGSEEVGSDEDQDEGNDVNEISGCSAAVGYTGPLGNDQRKNKRNR